MIIMIFSYVIQMTVKALQNKFETYTAERREKKPQRNEMNR